MVDVILAIVLTAVHATMLVLAAPLLHWAVDAVARRTTGRRPVSPYQPWRDLERMLRKQSVMADTASAVHRLRPWIDCAVALCLVLLIPAITTRTLVAPAADCLVLLGLWLLSQALAVLSLVETGRLPAPAHSRLLADRLTGLGLQAAAALTILLAVALPAGTTGMAALIDQAAGPLPDPAWIGSLLAGRLPGSDVLAVGLQASLDGLVTVAVLALVLAASGNGQGDAGQGDAGQGDGGWGGDRQVDDYSGRHAALVTAAAMLRRVAAVLLVFALLLPGTVHGDGDGALVLLLALLLLPLKLALAALVLGVLRGVRQRAGRRRMLTGLSIGCGLAAVLTTAAVGPTV